MDAYIYDAIRTPRGSARKSGSLTAIQPIILVSNLLDAFSERHTFDKEVVEDLVLGCVTQVKDQGANIAKIAALYAGWPTSMSGTTVNRFCASGLDATGMAAMKVHSAMEDVVIAGGVESVSRVPMFGDEGAWFADDHVRQKTNFVQMGISADIMATLEGFSREELDEYAVQSQERAAYARENGYFSNAIIPVKNDEGEIVLQHDELIRAESTVALLGKLDPSFERIGLGEAEKKIFEAFPQIEKVTYLHHAGNSPSLADGASLLLIGNEKAENLLGIKPRAKILASANASANPFLLTGGQEAAKKVLLKSGLRVEDIDLFEYNEAFAAAPLKFMKDLKVSRDQLNVNGGAISMGHALGATGGMLVATVLEELERRGQKRGLIAVSGGGGIGTALIIERMN
ncbi:acetyl-CoA C-acetyltransferase [Sporosarcina siberiensis]|uniref:Acetyl-CoA C-acetyltransferase n=1 Tax=Sporosarcina siberiensis TaxID=1365606 RepID=A0ABW4SKC0_9BACL